MSDNPDYICKIIVRLKANDGDALTAPDARDEVWLDNFADEIIGAIDRADIQYDGVTYEIDAQDVVDLEESN